VSSVYTRDNQPILAASTDRLHNIAGKYVGKDDPVCIIRTQKDFPATEEVGAAFNNPHLVAGNTRGSHHVPLMPVKLNSPASINYAIPIVSALVFSMRNGKLVGPVDGFASVDWDYIRQIAVERTIAIRSQGFVHPATLVPSELEYAEGYRARMNVLWSKMRPIPNSKEHQPHHQKQQQRPQQKQQSQPQRPSQQPNVSRPNTQNPQRPQNNQRPQQKQQSQPQRPSQQPNVSRPNTQKSVTSPKPNDTSAKPVKRTKKPRQTKSSTSAQTTEVKKSQSSESL
jgi:fructose 1,6-bisphosphate aldolase/phosphatase